MLLFAVRGSGINSKTTFIDLLFLLSIKRIYIIPQPYLYLYQLMASFINIPHPLLLSCRSPHLLIITPHLCVI